MERTRMVNFSPKPEFDRRRIFTVLRGPNGGPLKCNGREFVSGQTFDKTITSDRRLRQLYDHGFLKMEPEDKKVTRVRLSEARA
jgi:hypothetical protein